MLEFHNASLKDQSILQRLIIHHDHLKSLENSYRIMWREETIKKMRNPNFRPNPERMGLMESSCFTSLIIDLSAIQTAPFFQKIQATYNEIKTLIKTYYPTSNPETYFEVAHSTIKSIRDFKEQKQTVLERYKEVLHPALESCFPNQSAKAKIYIRGLFTNLTTSKGLTIGLKLFPSTPIFQILRGTAGVVLYNAMEEGNLIPAELRPENEFHTMLCHSSNLRVRDLKYPLKTAFVDEFEQLIPQFDNTIYGSISNLQLADLIIRNGYSNKLISVQDLPF